MALEAAEAVERTLDDVSAAGMWGLPPAGGIAGSIFFTLVGARVPPPLFELPFAQLLRDCSEAAAAGSHIDGTVDTAAGATCAQPGEVLFVLLTPSRRMAIDSPALVVRILRARGFSDAQVGRAWEAAPAVTTGADLAELPPLR